MYYSSYCPFGTTNETTPLPGATEGLMKLLRCRSITQRDWSPEDSTSNDENARNCIAIAIQSMGLPIPTHHFANNIHTSLLTIYTLFTNDIHTFY
jgi:hypothetical protein